MLNDVGGLCYFQLKSTIVHLQPYKHLWDSLKSLSPPKRKKNRVSIVSWQKRINCVVNPWKYCRPSAAVVKSVDFAADHLDLVVSRYLFIYRRDKYLFNTERSTRWQAYFRWHFVWLFLCFLLFLQLFSLILDRERETLQQCSFCEFVLDFDSLLWGVNIELPIFKIVMRRDLVCILLSFI